MEEKLKETKDKEEATPKMFNPRNHFRTKEHIQVYSFYERLYTTIDMLAGLAFVIGSLCYFNPNLTDTGTWLFLIGSLLFLARPLVRFLREFHFARLPIPENENNE